MTVHHPSRTSRRARLLTGAAAAITASALVLTGCSAGSGSSAQENSASGSAGECGLMPEKAPLDTDGAVATLPADVQSAYLDFPFEVLASGFADLPAKEKPFKVGYTSLPLINDYGNDSLANLEARVAEYAQQGVTDPKLLTALLADPATMTPAEQIQLFKQLVDQGADVILGIFLSGEAMADAVTEAGKYGEGT